MVPLFVLVVFFFGGVTPELPPISTLVAGWKNKTYRRNIYNFNALKEMFEVTELRDVQGAGVEHGGKWSPFQKIDTTLRYMMYSIDE